MSWLELAGMMYVFSAGIGIFAAIVGAIVLVYCKWIDKE